MSNINKDDLMNGLFGGIGDNYFGQTLPEVNSKHILQIPLDLIDDLKSIEHAYEKSLELGLGLDELAEQIKNVGQQQPAVLRKKDDGRYEVIIGHRRKRACRLAGKETLDAIIIDCSDDEAALISTDNLGQRPHTFPSEIAKAYEIQINALKNQGKRTDLLRKIDEENLGQTLPEVKEKNFGQTLPEVKGKNLGQTLPEVNARDIVAQKHSISARKVSNYLRLNELIRELLDMVDYKEIPFMAGVYVSFLNNAEQKKLVEVLRKNQNIKLTVAVADELRQSSKEMELTSVIIDAIVNPPAENDRNNDFKPKTAKPVYRKAFSRVEKYIKNEANISEKMNRVNQEDLEAVIKSAVIEYFNSL